MLNRELIVFFNFSKNIVWKKKGMHGKDESHIKKKMKNHQNQTTNYMCGQQKNSMKGVKTKNKTCDISALCFSRSNLLFRLVIVGQLWQMSYIFDTLPRICGWSCQTSPSRPATTEFSSNDETTPPHAKIRIPSKFKKSQTKLDRNPLSLRAKKNEKRKTLKRSEKQNRAKIKTEENKREGWGNEREGWWIMMVMKWRIEIRILWCGQGRVVGLRS